MTVIFSSLYEVSVFGKPPGMLLGPCWIWCRPKLDLEKAVTPVSGPCTGPKKRTLCLKISSRERTEVILNPSALNTKTHAKLNSAWLNHGCVTAEALQGGSAANKGDNPGCYMACRGYVYLVSAPAA